MTTSPVPPLSAAYRELLSELGVRFVRQGDRWLLVKPPGSAGNALKGHRAGPIVVMNERGEVEEEISSDCPFLQLYNTSEGRVLLSWNWVPGPGPGDLEIVFTAESQLMAFITSYFFGLNPYFEARRQWHEAVTAAKG